eukprot:5951586-Pyramimonas_sp.AAC.1
MAQCQQGSAELQCIETDPERVILSRRPSRRRRRAGRDHGGAAIGDPHQPPGYAGGSSTSCGARSKRLASPSGRPVRGGAQEGAGALRVDRMAAPRDAGQGRESISGGGCGPRCLPGGGQTARYD